MKYDKLIHIKLDQELPDTPITFIPTLLKYLNTNVYNEIEVIKVIQASNGMTLYTQEIKYGRILKRLINKVDFKASPLQSLFKEPAFKIFGYSINQNNVYIDIDTLDNEAGKALEEYIDLVQYKYGYINQDNLLMPLFTLDSEPVTISTGSTVTTPILTRIDIGIIDESILKADEVDQSLTEE
jgi:hypothetical protein